MKAGTLVAAWNNGGYCSISILVIFSDPYFGCLVLPDEVDGRSSCGTYVKLHCSPVKGSKSGGKNVSLECGMRKVKFFT